MCLFPTNGPGETTRKLRHDIIYSSLSIRLSKSPIDCAFNLLQRMWLSLLNAGCKVELYDKKTIYIKQGMSYLCWNNNYAKLSSGIPTSHILFIYNIIVYNQERTLVESYNFSIKENLKKGFWYIITEKHPMQSKNLELLKTMHVRSFSLQNCKRVLQW